MDDEKTEDGTAAYEITGPLGGVPVVLTEAEAVGFVFAGWTGGEHEANRKTGRQKIMDAYDSNTRVGDKHAQDAYVMQQVAWAEVHEAARAFEDFDDFKDAMGKLTFRLRWTTTRGDQERSNGA